LDVHPVLRELIEAVAYRREMCEGLGYEEDRAELDRLAAAAPWLAGAYAALVGRETAEGFVVAAHRAAVCQAWGE
jgi:hypothetical protein